MKIITLFLFILLLSNNARSQSWLDQYNQLETEIAQGEYAGAINSGKKLQQELDEAGLKEDTTNVNVLYYLANAYFYTADYYAAVEYGKQEVELCAKAYGEDHYFYQQSRYLLAILATYTADYDVSIPNFEAVLAMMKTNGEKDTDDYLTIAFQLAGIYDLAGSYVAAQELYEESYKQAKVLHQLEDEIMQQWTNSISSFYLMHGMYTEAEPFFLQSLAMMEKYYGKESENYVTVLNSLGEFYLYAGWYQKCAGVFNDFVVLCKKIYGSKSADYATSLNNLAVAYEKLEEYEKAEKYYLDALKIKAKVYKKESDFYALTLSNLAVLYDNMGRRQDAEKLYDEAISIYKSIHGAKSENYAVAISSLASVYSSSGKNEEAERLLQEALAIQKELFGSKHPAYITSLNNLGQVHYQLGNYVLAEKELEEVCALRREVQGETHPDYAISLLVLSNIKSTLQKYGEAELLLKSNLTIIEATQGIWNSTYANSLTTLAGVYLEMGRYLDAESAYLKSLEISEKIRGTSHPEHATILNNMAQLYGEMGLYEKSIYCGNQAIEITRNAFGDNDPNLIYPYTVLANVYKDLEDFKTAEDLILKAKKLTEINFGTEHPNYLNTIHNLAAFYYEMGSLEEAEPIYLLVAEKYAGIYGKQHGEYVNVLNGLGALYMTKMMYAQDTVKFKVYAEKAGEYFNQILSIDSVILDLKGQDFALHLNNAAELYRMSGNYTLAESYYLNSIENIIGLFGEDHGSLGVNYNNLGLLYENMGDRDQAVKYYLKSIEIKEKRFGSISSSLANSYINLASLIGEQGHVKEAFEYFKKGFEIDDYNIDLNFSFMTADEKLNYLKNSRYYGDLLNTFGDANHENFSVITTMMYDVELRNKGLVLKTSNQIKQQILNGKDQELTENYEHWISLKKELANQMSMLEENRTLSIDTLENQIKSLEKEINKSVQLTEKQSWSNWKEIRKSLKEGEAAIEFTHFYKQGESPVSTYGALILKANSEVPVYVELFEESRLLDIIGTYAGNDLAYINEVYGKAGQLDTRLFKSIWEPMMEELKGIKEVYYAPVGLLNKISFGAIGVSEQKYLSDLFTLNQVSSTVSINTYDKHISVKEISLFGGAKYSEEPNKDDIWKYLPGTKKEVEQIAQSFKDNQLTASLWVGDEATEEQFKSLEATAASIVHVATHGFFYPDLSEFESDEMAVNEVEEVDFRGGSRGYKTFVTSKDPLMRAGIVFTGANKGWEEQTAGNEDGVLTAYEVSNLNLSKVGLIVLSACETGLGEIKGSEGVYGLQRAFKSAGVEQMVMSLWQVPDKETQQFMVQFYEELLKDGNAPRAFKATQKIMKKNLDPFYWGAFVLVE
ncbi:MAG: tetratricopeptide repeat protein [Flavobacteriales bacterium]|nr:tetratricopeptide repeat protein [Flavobacteriales bacterium]